MCEINRNAKNLCIGMFVILVLLLESPDINCVSLSMHMLLLHDTIFFVKYTHTYFHSTKDI